MENVLLANINRDIEERAVGIFNKTLDENKLSPVAKLLLLDIRKGFDGQLSLMEMPSFYVAKRLANAILEVLEGYNNQEEFTIGDIAKINSEIILNYKNRKSVNKTVTKSSKEKEYVRKPLEKIHLDENSAKVQDEIMKNLRANTEDDVSIEEINLIHDMDISDLSIAGLKERGLIDKNFNVLEDTLDLEKLKEKNPSKDVYIQDVLISNDMLSNAIESGITLKV